MTYAIYARLFVRNISRLRSLQYSVGALEERSQNIGSAAYFREIYLLTYTYILCFLPTKLIFF